jgi:hypothetical protein
MFLPALVALLSVMFPSAPRVAWKKSFSLVGRPQIRVATNNLDVRVYASDRSDIEAGLYSDHTISPDVIADRQFGNCVEVDVRGPHQWRPGFGQRSVVLELKIPFQSDVEVYSGNGSVIVKDVEGDLSIHTDDGNVEALGIGGELKVESGHGDLRVNGVLTAVNLDTRAGNIAAQIDPGSKMNSAWLVRSGNGNLDLRLPENFSTDLKVETGEGNVRLDFPLATIAGKSQSSTRGPINGGGHRLELHSDKGNIMVRKSAGTI